MGFFTSSPRQNKILNYESDGTEAGTRRVDSFFQVQIIFPLTTYLPSTTHYFSVQAALKGADPKGVDPEDKAMAMNYGAGREMTLEPSCSKIYSPTDTSQSRSSKQTTKQGS